MIPQERHLFIIMVHYGDPAVTLSSLAALKAGHLQPTRILIIDHAEDPLRFSEAAGVHVVRPEVNGGYAAGLNVGLGVLFASKIADEDIVVCMNNDTEVLKDSLQHLLAYFTETKRPTLVGARWGIINPVTGRAALLPPNHPATSYRSLQYIDGAFFATTWSVLKRLKKIPDNYFMYWEESALNSELLKHGVARQVLPSLRINHDDSTTTKSGTLRTYYLVRNGAHYMQTFTSWPLRVWWRLYNRLRYLYHSVRPRGNNLVREALGDALAGTLGKRSKPL